MQKIKNKQATWSWGFTRHCRKVRYYCHQGPKKHSVYSFVERKKMDGILTELNLVQSMSKGKIERLGVTAIGDWVRLRELCKEDEENNSRSSFGSRSVGSRSTSNEAIYLKLTLYWRNKCIFSILEIFSCSLKCFLLLYLARLVSSFVSVLFCWEIFLIKNTWL